MTNTLGIMLEILNNYSWTRLSVRIIGTIKRQYFDMVTHIFDNSNLSEEIFAIDTWRAVICSLGHGCKRMLTIFPTLKRPGLKPGLHISCKGRKHMVANTFFKLFAYTLVFT